MYKLQLISAFVLHICKTNNSSYDISRPKPYNLCFDKLIPLYCFQLASQGWLQLVPPGDTVGVPIIGRCDMHITHVHRYSTKLRIHLSQSGSPPPPPPPIRRLSICEHNLKQRTRDRGFLCSFAQSFVVFDFRPSNIEAYNNNNRALLSFLLFCCCSEKPFH